MTGVPFDTLKFARHLEASGLAAPVAAGAAEAFADALTGAELATRADVAGTNAEIAIAKVDLRGEIAACKSELQAEIAATRTELRAEIATTRTEIAATRTELKYDIELLGRDITIKFGSMLVIAVGILLTAIRYLPPHP